MTAYSGTAGLAYDADTNDPFLEIKEWSLDVTQDVVDVSSFSDIWNENISGIRNVTGSFIGNFTDEVPNDLPLDSIIDGGIYNFRFVWLVGNRLYGPGVVTGVTTTIANDGAAQSTYSFVASGTWQATIA